MSADARPLRVVIAPDSYKGTCSATEAARSLAQGWRTSRPHDQVVVLPQADGGEGTIDAIAAVSEEAEVHRVDAVCGPDGRPVSARWLSMADGTAVVELAESSGLPLMAQLDPAGATSRGLGEVIAAALAHGAHRLVVGLGGSASTDGGAGALAALGARLLDDQGRPIPDGGRALADLREIRLNDLLPLPPGGVEILVDTTAVLFGSAGAARVFAPQKGADPQTVDELDRALEHWHTRLAARVAADAGAPGSGAAGGVGYALAAWGGVLTPGAARLGALTGLDDALTHCDVLVTGEGQYDATSITGKLVGDLTARGRAAGLRAVVVAGRLTAKVPEDVVAVDLTTIAGSSEAAMRDPRTWLSVAAASVASTF